ncbi:MAG: A24 family peptidase C-terminal domain-containing protein [Desulfurococcaceae archaeon]
MISGWISSEQIFEVVKMFLSIAILFVLGIQDLKSRELSETIVYLFLCCSLIGFIVSTFILGSMQPILRLAYATISLLVTIGVFLTLYKLNLIGDGDLYISTSLGLMFPYPITYRATLVRTGILPPSLIIVLYASMLGIIFSAINAVIVISRHKESLDAMPTKIKMIIPFIAKPVKLIDYLEGKVKHCHPIQVFKVVNGKVISEYKFLIDINQDINEEVKDLINKGSLSPNIYLWVTPGLPYVFHLLLGLIMLFILGDSPVLLLIFKLFGV